MIQCYLLEFGTINDDVGLEESYDIFWTIKSVLQMAYYYLDDYCPLRNMEQNRPIYIEEAISELEEKYSVEGCSVWLKIIPKKIEYLFYPLTKNNIMNRDILNQIYRYTNQCYVLKVTVGTDTKINLYWNVDSAISMAKKILIYHVYDVGEKITELHEQHHISTYYLDMILEKHVIQ